MATLNEPPIPTVREVGDLWPTSGVGFAADVSLNMAWSPQTGVSVKAQIVKNRADGIAWPAGETFYIPPEWADFFEASMSSKIVGLRRVEEPTDQ